MKWTTQMFTDPIVYIRKLESQLAEAQKQETLEHAPHASQPSQDRHYFEGLMQRLVKWMHLAAPHGKA